MSENAIKIKNGKINFCCKMYDCEHSCCGPFCGVTDQLDSIDDRPFDEIVLTQEDYTRLYENGYADLIEEGYSPEMMKKYYKMALLEDGTCKALDSNKMCKIHEINPTLCKAFPFYFDMFSGLCAIKCDGFSEECYQDMKMFEPNFEAARKMYEFWLDFYSGEKE